MKARVAHFIQIDEDGMVTEIRHYGNRTVISTTDSGSRWIEYPCGTCGHAKKDHVESLADCSQGCGCKQWTVAKRR